MYPSLVLLVLLLPAPAKGEVVLGELGAALDAHVRRMDEGFVGSVLVAKGGVIVLNKGYGLMDAKQELPMRPDAMWDWASASKQFTAAAILKLETMKRLRVDDPIRKHWREAPRDKSKVTLRHLLNHTSGITQPDAMPGVDPFDRDAVVRFWFSLKPGAEPGEKWEYSNLSYWVLAALIERVSGKSFEEFCIDSLFRPAGMKEACFIGSPGLDLSRVPLDDKGAGVHFAYGERMSWGYRGSGGAVVSLPEMLLWDRALRGDRILTRAAKSKLYEVGKNDYALGWFVDRARGGERYYHSGAVGKTVTSFYRVIDPDVVVALARSEAKPKEHPDQTGAALAELAIRGK